MDDSMCAGTEPDILRGNKKDHHTNGAEGGRGEYQWGAAGGRDADGGGGESEKGFGHRCEQNGV